MDTRARLLTAALCVSTLLCAGGAAQTPERRAAPQSQAQEPAPSAVSADPVANEIALLRRSLQTLNGRLREISEKLLGADVKGEAPGGKQNTLAQHLALLSSTEQRAEVMRKQLLELTERETSYRTRIMQLDEEMRPDSIDRSLGHIGTTRTTELRDTRRRVLDNERRGVEHLLNLTAGNRARLDEDVKQADALVARLRLRLLPLIEKEIDKINPNADAN